MRTRFLVHILATFALFSFLFMLICDNGGGRRREQHQKTKEIKSGNATATTSTTAEYLPQDVRLNNVERVCQRMQDTEPRKYVKRRSRFDPPFEGPSTVANKKPEKDNFMWDPVHNLMLCWNHKAASTSFAQLFSRLTDTENRFREDGKYYKLMKYLSPKTEDEFKEAERRSFKFTVVRHPFRRLVSAYRDRLVKNPDSFQARKFNPLIRGENSTIPPTFPQFVRFLLSTPPAEYDPHWTPFWLHCSPCSVSYDAIVKLETADRDMNEIFKMAPILRKYPVRRLGAGLEIPREQEKLLVKAHLMQLNKKELKELTKRYKFDFLLFGYHPNIV